MGVYRPPIRRSQFRQLENYLFALIRFSESIDFTLDITGHERDKLLREISYIEMSINIISYLYKGDDEARPIVGWCRSDDSIEYNYMNVYKFSSIKVATECLGLNAVRVEKVCERTVTHTCNWVFRYLDDYEKKEATIGLVKGYNINQMYRNEQCKTEGITETDGDV